MMVFGRNGVGELTKFHQHVLTAAMDLKVKLVIIDTAADVFGGSENDRNQVRQFVSRALGSIALGRRRWWFYWLVELASLAPFPSRAGIGNA